MTAYDTTYSPPAPITDLVIASVTNRRRRLVVPALLDTGSDITAIPKSAVDKVLLYPIGRVRIETVGDQESIVLTYAVRLSIGNLIVPRLETILTGLDTVILGRDVLNQLYVCFDGPALTFDVGATSVS